ncbi:MAG: hypothetical protein AAFY65_10015 [Pseudomonadota bacterium]
MAASDRVFLPKDVREGLERARQQDRKKTGGRLRVQVGDDWYPIRRFDERGFEVGVEIAPKLRGYVEIHDGPNLLRTALIIASEPGDESIRYEFKRGGRVHRTAPLDYARDGATPDGYLTAQ